MNYVTIEGPALAALAEAITTRTIYRLRISDCNDGTVKIKVNEGMWSPPITTDDNVRSTP